MLKKILLSLTLLLSTLVASPSPQNIEKCIIDGEILPSWVCTEKGKDSEKFLFAVGSARLSKAGDGFTSRIAISRARSILARKIVKQSMLMAINVSKNDKIKAKRNISYNLYGSRRTNQYKNSKKMYVLIAIPKDNMELLQKIQQNLYISKMEIKQILDMYKKTCKSGSVKKCESLAKYYTDKKDYVQSISMYENACDMGAISSCNALSEIYMKGKITTADPLKAKKLYKISCDKKSKKACKALASIYKKEKDKSKSNKFYVKSCKLGDIYSCVRISEVDPILIKSCKNSDIKSCIKLADIYNKYKDNYIESIKYLNKACELGDNRSCSKLANGYKYNSYGYEKNQQKVISYYTKACDNSDKNSCWNLAKFYKNTKTLKENVDKSTVMYQKACKLGHKKACEMIVK